MVSVSFLVPTPGRPSLEACLTSLAFQLGLEDECLVIGDTHDGPLPETERLVREFGRQFRYLEYDAGQHCWGHAQMNVGMSMARGTHLSFQDDDDVWVPGAVEVIHFALEDAPENPHLFRFVNYNGFLCWVKRGVFTEDHVGGHCLVCPNAPTRLGTWTARYAGDWDFVQQTVMALGGEERIVWHDDVTVISRPTEEVVREIRRVASLAVMDGDAVFAD